MRVIVIGAGIAGLATAALLGHAGFQVTIIEKNEYVGGRAHSITCDSPAGPFLFDCGPSWYLMPEAFERFFSLLGTSVEEELNLITLDPAYQIFSSDAHSPLIIHTGREKLIALAESYEPGGGNQMANYLDNASMVYDIALKFFLYTNFDSLLPFINKTLLGNMSLMITLLRTSLHDWAVKHFSSPILQKLVEYPAVFLSTTPKKAPALYSLLSHTDLVDGVRFPMGGFSTFIDALVRQCRKNNVEIISGAEVVDILYASHASGNRATGVRYHRGENTNYERLEADYIISCGDRYHTETALLPPRLRTWDLSYWAKRDPGISAIIALVGVSGKLDSLIHHQLFLNENWDSDFHAINTSGVSTSFYACTTTASDPSMAPKDCENLFLLIPTGPDSHLGHGTLYSDNPDPAIENHINRALTTLAQAIGLEGGYKELESRILVRKSIGPADFKDQYFSWRNSAIGLAHTLRQSAFLRGKNQSKTLPNLYYAGATSTPGVGVPMCLISAENILARLSKN